MNAILQREVNPSLFGALWGALLVCIPLLQSRGFRKQYRTNLTLHSPRCLEVGDVDIHYSSRDSEGRVSWNAYAGFAENEKTFILFQQGNLIFIPIPKRQLRPSQIDELRSLLATHLPQK